MLENKFPGMTHFIAASPAVGPVHDGNTALRKHAIFFSSCGIGSVLEPVCLTDFHAYCTARRHAAKIRIGELTLGFNLSHKLMLCILNTLSFFVPPHHHPSVTNIYLVILKYFLPFLSRSEQN